MTSRSPERFSHRERKVFEELAMSDFIKVANTSDIPSGEGRVIEIDGRAIALFNVEGQFYAIDNTCGHRGGPLGAGFCDTQNLTVQCPWHGWVYNIATGISTFNPTVKVQKFDVKVEKDEVKVLLD